MEPITGEQRRQARQRHRELIRRAKDQAKLSALEQAALEVETYENRLDVLLSVHKEVSHARDWSNVARVPPPLGPFRQHQNELVARWQLVKASIRSGQAGESSLREAIAADEREFQAGLLAYTRSCADWERTRDLAARLLGGDPKAYVESLVEFGPFAEISELGSELRFTVHSPRMIEAALKVNGKQAIPTEAKSLTASGKVSTKPMPRARFHQLYQDYICSCALRVAREVFALLPVETVLLTASADMLDLGTGKSVERPVISVVFLRDRMKELDYDQLDPSDAVERFQHRGDFKANRKQDAFAPIVPLTPAEVPKAISSGAKFAELLSAVRELREEIQQDQAALERQSDASSAQVNAHP